MRRWWRRLRCALRGHQTIRALVIPEVGVALNITRCRCGHIYEGSGRELQFPTPKQRMRRVS